MHRDRRILKGIAAGGAVSCLLLATCEPFTAPASGGNGNSNVSISIDQTAFGTLDSIALPVGFKLTLPISAKAAGVPVQNPIFTLTSQNTDAVKVQQEAGGQWSVSVLARGKVRIIATLSGAGSAVPPADTVFVQGITAKVLANQPVVQVASLRDTSVIAAKAFKSTGIGALDTITTAGFVFSSSNPAVATVDAVTGRMITLANGTTTITARSDTSAATIAVTVKQQLGKWLLSKDTVFLSALGDTGVVVGTVRDLHDQTVDTLVTNATPGWTIDSASIATIIPAGKTIKIVATANGITNLIAKTSQADSTVIRVLNGVPGPGPVDVKKVVVVKVAQVALTMLAGGGVADSNEIKAPLLTQQLIARAIDKNGAELTNLPITWVSSNTAVASVSTTGLVTGLTPGVITVTATRDGASKVFKIVVTNFPTTIDSKPDTIRLTSLLDAAPLTATVKNIAGVQLATSPVTWTSLNPAIASVNATGVVTAVSPGIIGVVATATAGTNVKDTTIVKVTNDAVLVALTPRSITLASINDTLAPAVSVKNARGDSLDRGAAVWSIKDVAFATVTSRGTLTAISRGNTQLIVTAGNSVDSIPVVVTNARDSVRVSPRSVIRTALPDTFVVKAGAYNARRDTLAEPAGVTWTNTNAAVATIVSSASDNARISIDNPGTALIIATIIRANGSAKSDTTVITATNAVSRVAMSRDTLVFPSVGGATQSITAVAVNNGGQPIPGAIIIWASSAPTIASVDGSGNVSALAPGAAAITATTGGKVGVTNVTVKNAPDVVIITTPDTILTSIGDAFHPAINFKDAGGHPLGAFTVSWSTSDTSKATVENTPPDTAAGRIKATGIGTAKITATSGAATGPFDAQRVKSFNVTVRNDPFSITLDHTNDILTAIGRTLNYTPTVLNKRGAPIPVSASMSVTWSSSNTARVTIDASGHAVAVDTGTVTITATTHSAGATDLVQTATLRVTNLAARHVVSPASVVISGAIRTASLTDQAFNDLGALIPGEPVTYVSLNPAIATVTTAGLVTGLANGTTSITATVDGIDVTVPVQVLAGLPSTATSTVSRSAASVTADGVASSLITVQLKDVLGNNITSGTDVVALALAGGSVGTLSTVAGGSGTYTATVTSTVVGTATISATLNGSPITTGSVSVTFVPGPASVATSTISATPGTAVANGSTTITITVQLKDALGNNRATAGDAVSLTRTGVGTFLAASGTTNASGVYTTTLTSTTTGSSTIAATLGGIAITTGNPTVTFTPGAASKLAIGTDPSASATTGVPFATQPVVRVLDVNNNLVTTSGVTVTAAILTGGGTLGGTLTAVASGGIATFTDLKINGTAGARTLQFTSTPLAAVNSGTVTLGSGAVATVFVSTQPAGAASGIDFTTQPVVQLRDIDGNVTSSTAAVTVSIGSGSGATLSGPTTVSAIGGVATFANLRLTGVVGSFTLQFSAASLTGNSGIFALAPGNANAVSFTTAPPGAATNGVDLAPQPVVKVVDASGNTVTGATGTMTATIATGSGGALVSNTAPITAGVATFSTLRLNGTAGPFTLQFSDGTRTVTSGTVALAAGAANAVLFTTTPSATATNGVNLATQPVVRVVDASGNTVTSASGTMTATIASGSGGSLVSATAPISSGVATFTSLRLNGTAGGFQLQFSDGARTVTSGTITLSAGAAAKLQLVTPPPATATNDAIIGTVAVRLLDAADNPVSAAGVSVGAGIATGGGALLGTTSISTDGTGLATFSDLRIRGVLGIRTLSFSSGVLTGIGTGNIDVNTAGSPAQLKVTQQASATPANDTPWPVQPKVQLQDVSGNAVNSAGLTVNMALNSGNTGLTGTPSAITDGTGTASFSGLGITGDLSARTYTFSQASFTIVSATITPVAGAAASVVFQQAPSGATNGLILATQPQIRALDLGGNTATTAAGIVTVSLGGGSTGALTGTLTKAFVAGFANFASVGLDGPSGGGNTLVFTPSVVPGTVTSGSLSPAVGAANAVSFTTPPGAAATNGTNLPTQPVVKVIDVGGNTVTAAGGTMTTTIFSGTGGVLASATTPITAGVATFSTLRLNGTAGSFVLRFSDGAGHVVNSAPITLGVGAANAVAFGTGAAPAATATNGVDLPTQPVVNVVDVGGNTVPSASGTMTASVLSGPVGSSLLSPTATITSGVATFSGLRLNGTAGAYVLQFNDGAGHTVNSVSITLGGGAAFAVQFQTAPVATANSGANLPTQPVVKVVDAGGNTVTAATGTMTASVLSGPTGSSLLGTTATITSGVATFSGLRLDGTAGSYVLQFNDGAGHTVNSVPITLGVGAATAVNFQTAPVATATNGVDLPTQPIVKVVDAGGFTVTTASGTMTASVFSGPVGSSLVNPTATITSGVATFSGFRLNGLAGTYVLQFNDGAGHTVNSIPITLAVGAADHVSLTTQPTGSVVGQNLTGQPVLEVRDAGNNLVAGSSASVTASIASGGGVLRGTLTKAASSGVVTFTDLRVDGLTTSKTLRFNSGSLTPDAISAPFTPTVGAADTIRVVAGDTQTDTIGAPLGTPLKVIVVDAGQNPVVGATVTFAAPSTGTRTPTSVPTDASGFATTNWTLGNTLGAATLGASISGGATPAVTFHATVNPGNPDVLSKNAGDAQTDTIGAPLGTPLQVKVVDRLGNPRSGITITFNAPSTGSRTPTSAVTDASGLASTAWTFGNTLGAATLVATMPSGTTNSVTFNGTVTAGNVDVLSKNAGDAQTDTVGAPLGTPLEVKVVDRLGNPKAGVTVTFNAPSSGSRTPTSGVTDAAGLTSTAWTFGNTPGAATLVATMSGGTTNSVTFNGTVNAGNADVLLKDAGDAQTDTIGAPLATPLRAKVVDRLGNAVAGVTVTFNAPSTGTRTPTSAVSDASGFASTAWTFGNTLGTASLVATMPSGTTTIATFTGTVTPGNVDAISKDAGDAQADTIGAPLATSLRVKVVDRLGNPVSGVTVTFNAPSTGTRTPTSAVTDGSGLASTAWTLGNTLGAASLVATIASGTTTIATFTSTVNVGQPILAITTQPGVTTTSDPLTPEPVVTVKDRLGNPYAGVSVVPSLNAVSGVSTITTPQTAVTTGSGVATFTVLGVGTATTNTFTITFTYTDGTYGAKTITSTLVTVP